MNKRPTPHPSARPAQLQAPQRQTWRLAAARVCAWALLLAAWLSLGDLGARRLPQWAGGLLPLALWLLAIAAGLQLARRKPPSAALLRGGLPLLGLAAAGLVLQAGRSDTAALLILAPVWAALLVLASHTVRGLRRFGVPRLPGSPTPVLPACLGGVLALAAHAANGLALPTPWPQPGAPVTQSVATAVLLLSACLLLGALVPSDMARAGACRAGLFDCSLPLVGSASSATGPRQLRPLGTGWPMRSASLLMLPMMAALPVMAPWCGGIVDGPALSALHLTSMLLPAFLMSLWPTLPLVCTDRRRAERQLDGLITACLGAGVLCWALLPGAVGLLALALCHGGAWSLAWSGPMLFVDRLPAPAGATQAAATSTTQASTAAHDAGTAMRTRPSALPRQAGLTSATQLAAAPLLVLALGWSIANLGVTALIAVHLALALWAITGVCLTCSFELLARKHGNGHDGHPAQSRQDAAPVSDRHMASAPTWRTDLP
jgi:hypothetical protein